MTWLNESMLDRAGRFLWTSGRVLEQRRFAWHFGGPAEPADREGLLAALDGYRTPDGGYAFGLEPDVRGPAPQPLAVPTALRVLAEAGALGADRLGPLCDWLAGVAAPDGGVPSVLRTLRPYPRPPWLPIADEPPGDLLATGQIVGPLLRSGFDHPWLEPAVDFCRRAVEALQDTHPTRWAPPCASWTRSRTIRGRGNRRGGLASWCGRSGSCCWTRRTRSRPGSPPATRPASSTSRTTTHPSPAAWPGPGSPTRRWTGAWRTSPGSSRRTAAGRSAGRSGPRLRWSRPGPG
ncbi:hypothetical protein ACFQZC_21815 [Streptacidiphilus monticola]